MSSAPKTVLEGLFLLIVFCIIVVWEIFVFIGKWALLIAFYVSGPVMIFSGIYNDRTVLVFSGCFILVVSIAATIAGYVLKKDRESE